MVVRNTHAWGGSLPFAPTIFHNRTLCPNLKHKLLSNNCKVLLRPVVSPGRKRGNVPHPKNPGKFAKDGEQPTPQPAISIDSRRKFKFSLNFSQFLLKFLKNFQIFKLSKFSIKFQNLFKLSQIFIKTQSLTLLTIQYT